jgi:hypothetical protein
MGRVFGKLKPYEINCSGNYKLPFKNGEVTNCRRAATIEVFAQRGVLVNDAFVAEKIAPVLESLFATFSDNAKRNGTLLN